MSSFPAISWGAAPRQETVGAQSQLGERMDRTVRQQASHPSSEISAFSLATLLNPVSQYYYDWEKELKVILGLTVASAATCTHAICQNWTQGLSKGAGKEGDRGHVSVRACAQQAPTGGLSGREG